MTPLTPATTPFGITADASRGAPDRPTTYRLEIAGHLDDHWSDWLGGMNLVRNTDHTTTLTSTVADQAQLHGILTSIRDIGAALLALRQVDQDDDPNAADGGAVTAALARVLHTERLVLRAATPADADATWAYRRLDNVNEWLTGVPTTLEDYRALFAAPSRLATTVMVQLNDRHGGAVIGDFMLRREDAWSQTEVSARAHGAQAELGWVLDPIHTGSGYATEAVRELLRHCFEELEIHRVVANCFLANDTSWRLMERVGMRREAHAVKESLHRSGEWLDTVGYALLAEEWNGSTGPR